MEKKKLSELPELQRQFQGMGIPEEDIQKAGDAVVSVFDLTTKTGRTEARKAFYEHLEKDDSGKDVTMIGDPVPPQE